MHLLGDFLRSLPRLDFVSGLLDGAIDEDVEGLGHMLDRAVYLPCESQYCQKECSGSPSEAHLLQVRRMLACYPLVRFSLHVSKRDGPLDEILVDLFLLYPKLIDRP